MTCHEQVTEINPENPNVTESNTEAQEEQQTGVEANRQELQPGHPPAGFDRTLGGVLSPDGEYMAVSATVARRGDHVFEPWLDRVFMFLSFVATKAGVALEVGSRAGHAHLQVTAAFLVTVPFVDACKAIAKALKAFVPIRNGDKGVVQVKHLVGSQSFLGLVGYITKLPLQVRLWNISPSMVKEGQQLYALVKVDPLAGKRALNKSNIMKELYAFWHRNLRPTWFPAEAVTLYMIQSGEYMPTSVWLIGGSGQGLDINKVTVFWKLVHKPEDASMSDIMSIFYSRPTLAQHRLVLRLIDATVVYDSRWLFLGIITSTQDWNQHMKILWHLFHTVKRFSSRRQLEPTSTRIISTMRLVPRENLTQT